jgi:hypothetical protein
VAAARLFRADLDKRFARAKLITPEDHARRTRYLPRTLAE